MIDPKVKKLIEAAKDPRIHAHLVDISELNKALHTLRDAISAIEHEGQVQTADGEYVEKDAEVWRIHGDEHAVIISKCRAAYKPSGIFNYDFRFAHYPNARAKIDELMGQTPTSIEAKYTKCKWGLEDAGHITPVNYNKDHTYFDVMTLTKIHIVDGPCNSYSWQDSHGNIVDDTDHVFRLVPLQTPAKPAVDPDAGKWVVRRKKDGAYARLTGLNGVDSASVFKGKFLDINDQWEYVPLSEARRIEQVKGGGK